MKFYIASKLENFEQVQYLRDRLKEQGWTHTYDWTQHGSVKTVCTKILKEVAEKEFQGVADADVVIVLTPQGRGTHVELGIALALEKKFLSGMRMINILNVPMIHHPSIVYLEV